MISKEVWGRYIADNNGSGDVTLLDASSKSEALEDLAWEYERHLTREERRKVFQLFAFKTIARKAETPEDEEKLDAMQADELGWLVDGWLLDSPSGGCPWDDASDTVGVVFNGEPDDDYIAYKASQEDEDTED